VTDGRVVIGLSCLVALTVAAAEPPRNRDQPPHVEHNRFVSSADPKIRVKVNGNFEYVGKVAFTIDDQAEGNRYVFVHATQDKHIQQMFIIQQEGFLASSRDIYRYKITTPARLGNFDYQHSVILYDNDANIREAPGKEADLTQRFLVARGYVLEPELVMSRFARSADSARKHEIIFFCFENLSSYGHRLTDFPKDADSPGKLEIKRKVDENCHEAFRVND
jgi:hypothetical protein